MTEKYTPDPVPYTPAPTPYTPVSTPYTPTSLPYTPAPTPYTPASVSYQEYRNEYKDPNAYDASQYLSRFNDPFAINSILDVISNEAALIKHYGSSDVSSRFKALRDLFWLRTWKPISQGDFGTAALNLIPAITEPLDILGNIAKALLSPVFASDAAQVDYDTAEQILAHHANKPTPVLWDEKGRPISYSAYVNGKHYRYSNRELAMYENIVNSGRTVNPYKLTTSERLKASIGLGKHGRINFNYDTNSLLVDMFLEIVTDPQTIISIGAGALTGVVENSLEKSVKTFLKEGDTALLRAMPGLSKEAANDILTMVAKQTSEKAMYKQVTEYLLKKEITIAANEPAKAWLTRLLGKAVNETTATKTYAIKNLADALSVTLFYSQKGVNADTVKQTADILQRAMSKYVNHTAINVLKTVKLTDDVLNAAQSALTKAALSPSGIYPTYKLIQKGVPQVADWVNNLLKASTELYTNESGRRSIISFSDGLSNFYKTNLTIADGLGDELAALYNPKYIAQFYPQMAVDRVMLGDIFSKLSKANVDETLAAYRAYMKANHHGLSIRELADAAQKVDHLLEGADIQTTAYAKYLNQLSERISKIEAGVEFVRKANAANKIVEVAGIDAIPKAHIFLLQENLLKIPDVTLAVEATAKQLEEMLYEFVKPVRLLSDISAGLAKKFREDMTALYGKYFHEFIKNKDATVNAYEISRRLTQYTEDVQNILDRLYTRKASIVREESALQALKRAIASNEKNVKKFTETADALSEAAIKQRKVAGDYAVFNSNSSETVMDSPFVKSKAVKDLFGDIDLTDPKAVKDWYTPIREWQSIKEPIPPEDIKYVTKERPITKYETTTTYKSVEGVHAPLPGPDEAYHYTLPENVDSIINDGFDVSKPAIHSTTDGGKYGSKHGVIYLTRDTGRWSTYSHTVGEGLGDQLHSYYDRATSTWIDVKNAQITKALEPVKFKISPKAKGKTIDNLEEARRYIGLPENSKNRYETIEAWLDKAKAEGYDYLEIKQGNGWLHPEGAATKYGEKDWYSVLTGSSSTNDIFVFNKNIIDKGTKLDIPIPKNPTVTTKKAVTKVVQEQVPQNFPKPLTDFIWRNDTVIKTFNSFFNTPLNSPDYDKAFGQFQRFMKNLESTMTHWFKAGSEELLSFNSIMEELNLISPHMLKKRAKAIDEWTTYFRLKIENLAMLVTSVEDKRVIDFITQIQTGNFSKLTQEFLEAGGADAADKALVEQINNLAKQFIATKTLLSELNEAAIGETTRAGLLSSLSSFSHRPSESLSSDVTSFLKRLIERAEVNIQQTFQRDEALNLDFIFQKNRDAINKYRSVLGLEPLLKEAHIGADDIITTDFVLTELLKDNTDVSALLKSNRKRVAFDFETWHTDVSTGNQLHQGAISVFENNKVKTQVFGLHSDTIANGFFPGPDYLNKLFPNMSREAQEKAYLASRSGTFRSEADLIEAIVKHLWDEVKDTYDETADAFSAVFVTHHGAGFDLPLLKIKARQHGIDKIIDTSFLDKVEMFDTYKLLREQKNYFAITTDEVTELLPIFQRYGEAMTEAKATRLFNAMSTEELLTIKEELLTIKEKFATTGTRKKLFFKEFIQTFDELSQSLEGALDVFKEIKHTNELLGSKLYPKHLFTSTLENGISSMQNATKEQWIEFLHSLGFNDKQIARQFGDLDSLNATTIIGAIGSEAGIAYAKAVDDVLVDKWFVGTAARVGDASASRELTEMLTNVARKIDNYAKNFFAPDEFLPYKETFKAMTDTLIQLRKGTELNPNNLLGTVFDGVPGPRYLQYLRTENLNIREQWALLRYMKDTSEEELWDIMIWLVFTARHAEDELDTIKGLLKSFGGKELLVTPKYLQHSEFTNAVVDYTEQYFSLLNLTSNFDQFSKYLDDPGEHMAPIFEGSAQLHRRAAEPVVNVLKDLKEYYEKGARTISGRVDVARQYAKEVRGADQMSQKIIRSFINKDLDEVIPWMVDAKLPVMFPTGEITTAEHTAFINKFTSAPFREANIEVHTEGYWTYVWLTKNAKVHATVDEDGVVTYLVNGKTYSKPVWEQLDAKEMTELAYSIEEVLSDGSTVSIPILDSKKVSEAIEALSFMTDGASGHSMYELLKQTDLERIMNKLPAKVLEGMPELDSFKNPAMWLGSQFNHAVLGSSSARREYLEYSSGHLMLNLQNATYNRLRDHGTVNVYAQALMNNVTAVQNTAIGNIMRDYPEDFIKYISGNPEYTVAALVPAKNKLGYKVKGFNLNTKAGVKAAYEANANIMTISEFNKLYEVINQNIWSETQASIWLSLVRLFKIGYLGTPGTWTRNLYDTVIKNTQVTGENPFVVAKQYATAFKDLRDYDKIVQMLHDLGDELAGNDEALRAFFKGSSIMDYDKYQFLHRFFNDAAAGGEASIYRVLNKPKQDSYWEALLKYGAVTPEMKTSFERKRWFNNITNAALNPMNEIERVARLAEYQLFTKQGLTNTKAVHLIEKTHYAYSVKSTVEQTMELLIPFYTFANRNLQYWMEVVEKDPTFLVGLRDFLDPLWNLEQYNADEMQNSNSLQNNIFSGNIPLGDSDWYLKTGFSFMDAFQILTDPINQTKSRIFSPVQAVVDVLLQRGSDELYKANRETASNWLQNTFGTKITQAQLEAKYGDWAAEYQKLYPYKVSSENPMSDLLEVFKAWQYVPLIGTQISRFENTNLYYDGDGAKKLLYLTGLAGKRTAWSAEDAVNSREKLRYKISALIEDSSTIKYKWQEVLHRNGYGDSVNLYMLNHNELERLWNELSEGYKKVNTELYEYLQKDDDYIWMYSRLRAALGYADVPMSQLPVEVREMLLAVMKEQGTNVDISPVLQEQAEFTFMWAATKRKYGYADAKYAEIPSTDMDKICLDIAKGAMVLTEVRNMLATDPSTRYSYSVAKQNLGYGELQLYQLPTDALKLLKAAMVNKVYGVGAAASSTNIYAQAPKPKRMYAKQTWTNQTPYNTSKGVYANYGHASTQMSTQMQGLASNKGAYLSHRPNVYGNSYTKTGKSRMQTRMMPVTPRNLLPQIKSLFSYYR